VGADHREHCKREGDVGGSGNSPAGQIAILGGEIDCDVEQGGYCHPAQGGGDGQRRTARIAQVPGDELAFEFQAGNKEEDCEQPVGGPSREGQVQM
jgi:hypothetical protein